MFADTMGEIVAFVVLGGAGFAAFVFFSKRHATKRREKFAAFARSHDLAYLVADPTLIGRWRGVPFSIGSNWSADNAVSGRFMSREIVAFDYCYETVGTDQRSTTRHCNGIVAMTMPGALPYLQVEPAEVIGGELGVSLGLRENADFDRAFLVNAVDDRFRQKLLDARMKEFLVLADDRYSWRFEGDTMVCWTPGLHEPDQILVKLDHLRKVLDQVPPAIWRDFGGVKLRDSPPA